MKENLPEFLKILEDKDPEYAKNVIDNFESNFSDGSLSAKTKTLIALALDAKNGDIEGVKALTKRAKELGTTEDELIEVAEVVEGTCGLQGLAAASKALDKT